MGIPNLPEVPHNATLEQLTQIVASLSQELTYLLSGFLNSTNVPSLTGCVISSKATGDKVVLDAEGFHTYTAGVERLTIGTTTAKGVKAITGRDSAGAPQSVYTYDTEALGTGQYITAHGASILIKNDGTILVQSSTGSSIRIPTGFAYPEINSNGGAYHTIARSGASTSTQPDHDHGISAGVTLATTSDGSTVDGFVTWVPSGGHSHTQT